MSEKLLRKKDIAAILDTTPNVAASVLAKYGCHPIDFGIGRSKGLRWLESAVYSALRAMNANNVSKSLNKTKKSSFSAKISQGLSISEMSANELYNCVSNITLPKGQFIQ